MIKLFIQSKVKVCLTFIVAFFIPLLLTAQLSFAGYLTVGYAGDPDLRLSKSGESTLVGAGLFVSISQPLALGMEAGNHFGIKGSNVESFFETFVQKDIVITQDYESSLLWGTVSVRWASQTKKIKPYAIAGIGMYVLHHRFDVTIRDTDGATIPQYPDSNDEGNSSSYGGLNLGVGVDFERLVGLMGIGLEARWHLVFSGGDDFRKIFPSFVTIGVVLSFH